MANVPSNIGRYAIVKAIGRGGMGALYLAWDAKLERQIAIKVLNEDDDELRERFAREAKSAARLRHPHIVTIFELGEHDGQPYIAMEYIQGRTLAQIIRQREEMPLVRTLEWIAALCDGLAFAHRAGIIHRDVKPANIMVDEQGSLKILDFGIARLADSAGMTQSGMMMGTLNYMSPEQASGLTVDHRSDIFAVGLVFYELLTQKEAFPGTISTGLLGKLLHSEPVPLAQVCPGLDADVVRIVSRAIEKDVTNRYQDLAEMRRQVLTVRGHLDAGDAVTRVRHTPAPVRTTPVPGTPAPLPATPSPAPSTPAPTGSAPNSGSDRRASERNAIAQRRASQIQQYLDEADRAIAEGRYDAAIAACDQLLMLDAEHARALDLGDRARAAIEARQAEERFSHARLRKEIDAGPPPSEPTIALPVFRKSSSRTGTYIAIAAGGLVVLAAAAYWLGPFRSAAPDATTSSARPVTSPQPQPQRPAPSPTPAAAPAPVESPPPADPQLTRANELAREGQRLLGESKLGQARAQFEQAQALAATPVAQAGLAEIDRRQGEWSRLITSARTDIKRSRFKDAISKLLEAQTIDPEASAAADFKADLAVTQRSLLAAEQKQKDAAAAAAETKRLEASRKPPAPGPDKTQDKTPAAGRAAGATGPPAAEPGSKDDRSAIATLLGRLSSVLSTETNNSRNVNEVLRIWPGAGRDVFGDNEMQQYLFSNPVFVVLTAGAASVDCDRARLVKPRSTGVTRVFRDSVRLELRKTNGAWQVVTMTER